MSLLCNWPQSQRCAQLVVTQKGHIPLSFVDVTALKVIKSILFWIQHTIWKLYSSNQQLTWGRGGKQPCLERNLHSVAFCSGRVVLQLSASQRTFSKIKTIISPYDRDTMRLVLSISLPPLSHPLPPTARKSGKSEGLYGQHDVISSSYGATRALCLVEAAHMWHV